jgi:hypothetical protein
MSSSRSASVPSLQCISYDPKPPILAQHKIPPCLTWDLAMPKANCRTGRMILGGSQKPASIVSLLLTHCNALLDAPAETTSFINHLAEFSLSCATRCAQPRDNMVRGGPLWSFPEWVDLGMHLSGQWTSSGRWRSSHSSGGVVRKGISARQRQEEANGGRIKSHLSSWFFILLLW